MTPASSDWLRERLWILDGSTGTMLQRLGMPAGACPEQFCLEHPEPLLQIQSAYLKAGSHILYTPTFGANREKLRHYGLDERTAELNRRLAGLTLETARSTGARVAGDVGPTGLFFEPFGEAAFDHGLEVFRQQIGALAAAGVDLIVIETQIDIQEARIALLAAKSVCALPVIVSMTFDRGGRTLTGSDPLTCLNILQALGADGFGLNCSTGPEQLKPWLDAVRSEARIPLLVKPNAGLPEVRGEETVFPMGAEEFALQSVALADGGAAFLGGCCGTTPEHIAALAGRLRGRPAPASVTPSGRLLLSSPRRTVALAAGGETPLRLIGERINPTGKPNLQEELRTGRLDIVRQLAVDQARQGADLLDVNLGLPGLDETAMMRRAVAELSVLSDAPLVIDSSRPEVIAEALRLYPGRALVNSLTGERAKREALVPVLAQFGAAFILLPLDDRGIPAAASGRRTVIETVLEACAAAGIPRDRALVDGLVMTVSSGAEHAGVTLDTLAAAQALGLPGVIGLSNVSFGLPGREYVNAVFLAMAATRGLAALIANPSAPLLRETQASADLLTGRDPGARSYLARMAAGSRPAGSAPAPPATGATPAERLHEAILHGEKNQVDGRLDAALAGDVKAFTLVQQVLIPAIQTVGERYERREYFLPQLVAAAEAMERAMTLLGPRLRQDGRVRQGLGVLATVKGDIHDIGKKIVILLLRNHGYEIVDLGKSVDADTIVRTAAEQDADFIGLSALMTTTLGEMETVIRKVRDAKIRAKILVGGAVVTPAAAQSMGADGFAPDAVRAVAEVGRLLAAPHPEPRP